MQRPGRQLIPLILGGIFGLSACTTAPPVPPAQQAMESQGRQMREALLKAGDADSLAAAAVLVSGPHEDYKDRYSLLTRAVALAPERADLRWLQISVCTDGVPCDAVALGAELHRRDGDNAAAWLPELRRATEQHDASGVQSALHAMAGEQRLVVYYTQTVSHLTAAIEHTHLVDEGAAFSMVVSGEVIAMPVFHPLSVACRGPALDDPDRASACQSIAGVLRRGDTFLSESMGMAIARRAWPEGSRERNEATEARRIERYRMHASGMVLVEELRSDAGVREYLALLNDGSTEQGVTLVLLEQKRQPLKPPADWQESGGND